MRKSAHRASAETSDHKIQHAAPSPSDFDTFLPWACRQYMLPVSVITVRQEQREYIRPDYRRRSLKSKTETNIGSVLQSHQSIQIEPEKSFSGIKALDVVVKIVTIYSNDKLIQLKFLDNHNINRRVMIMIKQIIKFHPYVDAITVNRGIDKYIVYEISKILSLSNITELCLDNSFLAEANYDILLEYTTQLKNLSLSRCSIGDKVVKHMAAKLVYPLPASKTLVILNLSSNIITDVGVEHLAEALRSNIQLKYLNLANNRVTDIGGEALFNILQEFLMTDKEISESKLRRMEYLKKKLEIMKSIIADSKIKASSSKLLKSSKGSTGTAKKVKNRTVKTETLNAVQDTPGDLDGWNKNETTALSMLSPFIDPFNETSIIRKFGKLYCTGNFNLLYLNLAYNNLSYMSLKKLLSVLRYQKLLNKKPKGLVNVCIEGNPLPVSTPELTEIDDILEYVISFHNATTSKKRLKQIESKRFGDG